MTTEEFKEIQRKRGLTNKQMAELLCCSERYVEMIRAGKRRAGPQMVKILELTE